MLFQLLANDVNELAGENNNSSNNNDASNRRIASSRGGKCETLCTSAGSSSSKGLFAPPSNAIITKIPSMSEINYINYINATRMGMANQTQMNPVNKSAIFSGLPGTDAAFMISMTQSKEDCTESLSPSLYDILDKYYQMCKFIEFVSPIPRN